MNKYIGGLFLISALTCNITTSYAAENENVRIYYIADVTGAAVTKLIKTIDDINKDNNAKRIYLYINSYGGDMDAGKMAYLAIKSSRIPVTTVAMVTVGSSATMMLCAADDRRALTDASIYLHPSWIKPSVVISSDRLRPDNIEFLNKESQRFNGMFSRIYKACTSFSDDEIKQILYSESNRVTLTTDEAINKKLISKVDDQIISSKVAYYISDAN